VILLMPLFFYLKRNENGRLASGIRLLFSHPLGLLVIPVAILVETLLLQPETYALYAMTLHGFLLGLLVFLSGFLMVFSGPAFWETVLRWRWLSLMLAVGLFMIRLVVFDLEAPNYLPPFESGMWIFALLGFGYRSLNHPSKTLSYLSRGAYPIYILHMLFLYLGALCILPLQVPASLQFVLLVTFTFTGCFLSYELIIRRIRFLHPLFGLKPEGMRHTRAKVVIAVHIMILILFLPLL
jgi:hypothetical protein